MNFTKATNNQLWTIISDDWYIPNKYLRPLVEEALSRNLFNGLIGYLVKKLFSCKSKEYRNNLQDLYSVGFMGLTIALNRYKGGSASFKTFAYTVIESQLLHHRRKINAQMREHYKDMLSLDFKIDEDRADSFLNSLIDYSQNPEQAVIKKMFWMENFDKVSERDREILLFFSQGYSLNELTKHYGYAAKSSVKKRFHKAIKKINPDAGKFDLRSSGLSTKPKKGAVNG